MQLYDGVCDETRKIRKLNGAKLMNEDWIFYSIGRYMFVEFINGFTTRPGFSANIHYGKIHTTYLD